MDLSDIEVGDDIVMDVRSEIEPTAGDRYRVEWHVVGLSDDGIEFVGQRGDDETATLTADGEVYGPGGELEATDAKLLYRKFAEGDRTSITAYEGELQVLNRAKNQLEEELDEYNLSLHEALVILADRYITENND